jgi:hypothetical protein
MTAAEIAERVLTLKGEPLTEKSKFDTVGMVRHHLRRYDAEGLVQGSKIKGTLMSWTLTAKAAKSVKWRLGVYGDCCNRGSTHSSLEDAPNSHAIEADGRLVSREFLGGVHHRYGL